MTACLPLRAVGVAVVGLGAEGGCVPLALAIDALVEGSGAPDAGGTMEGFGGATFGTGPTELITPSGSFVRSRWWRQTGRVSFMWPCSPTGAVRNSTGM